MLFQPNIGVETTSYAQGVASNEVNLSRYTLLTWKISVFTCNEVIFLWTILFICNEVRFVINIDFFTSLLLLYFGKVKKFKVIL